MAFLGRVDKTERWAKRVLTICSGFFQLLAVSLATSHYVDVRQNYDFRRDFPQGIVGTVRYGTAITGRAGVGNARQTVLFSVRSGGPSSAFSDWSSSLPRGAAGYSLVPEPVRARFLCWDVCCFS